MTELWMIMAVAVGILIVMAFAFLRRNKKQAVQNNSLLTLGTSLVVLSIIFGDERLVGYSFIVIGVLLSIISVVKELRKRTPKSSIFSS